MKLAASELKLLCITLAVVVLGVTYLFGKPKIEEWKTFHMQRTELEDRLTQAEALLQSRPDMETRLAAFRDGLPVFPPSMQSPGAELMANLERMTRTHGIVLLTRQTGEEHEIGDLFEVAISGRWEGTLESLVRFLHAQQSLGPVSDVKDLTISPAANRNTASDKLSGSFIIDYAYRRSDAANPSNARDTRP